jgi:murein DD-endopeptidase MepM/ murein hydrolase activator NlpD
VVLSAVVVAGGAVVIAFVLLLSHLSALHTIHSFFNRHPDRIMVWHGQRADFFASLTNHLLSKKVSVTNFQIKPGLHFWKLAKDHDITVDTIIGANPFLTSITARVGDVIAVPDKPGVLHYVQENETLGILSALYNTKESEIRSQNSIPFFGLRHGDILYIPKAKPKVLTPKMAEMFKRRVVFAIPCDGWVRSRGFGMKINPFTGKLSMHNGVDMKADKGSPIYSAAEGVIEYAGPATGYGNLIVVRHVNYMETYYGHCSAILVRNGQAVKRKQVIGLVGETGMATTPHLHFEIRTNGKPIDPMQYLW